MPGTGKEHQHLHLKQQHGLSLWQKRVRCARAPGLPWDSVGRESMHKSGLGARKFQWAALRRGSMTIECAVILPLIIFVAVNILFFMEIFKLQVEINGALSAVGKELSGYAYAADALGEGLPGQYTDLAAKGLSTAYLKSQLVRKVGESRIANSCIRNKGSGLHCGSSLLAKEGDIDLVVNYTVEFPVNIFGAITLPIVQRARVHPFTGYSGDGGGGGAGGGKKVYVTKTGTVMHASLDCSHLRLSIQKVSAGDIQDLRNADNGKYYPCERCCKQALTSPAYITDTGDRYHSTLGCSGLKRQIVEIPVSQAGEYRQCLRCGGG